MNVEYKYFTKKLGSKTREFLIGGAGTLGPALHVGAQPLATAISFPLLQKLRLLRVKPRQASIVGQQFLLLGILAALQ